MTSADERRGVVTMLDVLGWKGIYNRLEQPLQTLRGLVDNLQDAASNWSLRGYSDDGTPLDGTLVRSISDTIAIFNQVSLSDLQPTIELHGLLCAEAIRWSLLSEIPVRGATSIGDFEVFESMFVGKAIDEAAAWYEQGDWVGVHLTPSAEFAFDAAESAHWVNYPAPLRTGRDRPIPCVRWTDTWFSDEQDRTSLQRIFTNMGPITPDISTKFTNTLSFYDCMTQDEPKG